MSSIDLEAERTVVLGLLAQEDGLYERLADLAEAENETILSGAPELLEQVLVEKEQLIERVLLLEAERLASVGRLATGLGADPAELTLTRLTSLWSDGELEQVSGLQERLQANIQRITELNRRNAALLRSSLVMLNRWIDLLVGGSPSTENYGRGGKQKRRGNPVAFNRTA